MVGVDTDLDDEVLLAMLNSTPVVDGVLRDAWRIDDDLRTWARARVSISSRSIASSTRTRSARVLIGPHLRMVR